MGVFLPGTRTGNGNGNWELKKGGDTWMKFWMVVWCFGIIMGLLRKLISYIIIYFSQDIFYCNI